MLRLEGARSRTDWAATPERPPEVAAARLHARISGTRPGGAVARDDAAGAAGGDRAAGSPGEPAVAAGGDRAAGSRGEPAVAVRGDRGSRGEPAVAAGGDHAAGEAAAPPRAHAAAPRPLVRDAVALEDFVGGRVLAWLGGVAVVAGLAFLLTVAVSRGWIGEGGRTALAGLLSTALLVAGARLREKRVRNDATLAAAAAGVAGLFGTLVVAGQVYDLIPVPVALLGALAVGAAATALAVRWQAQVMGWLGLVGALLAPAVLGDGAIAFLAVAYGATVAVLTWQRWTALAFTAFALATPQWTLWIFFQDPAAPEMLLALVAFGVLTTAAAVGFELRRRAETVRIAAVVLLVLDAVVLDTVGASVLDPAWLWLAGVAAAHLAVGLAGTRIPRVSRELSLVALGLGVILADVAFASFASGLPLVLGWAATTVGFGALLRRAESKADRAFAMAGLGGHLLSALIHALLLDVPSSQLGGGSPGIDAILAVAAVGAGAAISGRLADRFRIPLDVLALAALAYATTLALEGAGLTAALAGEAVALATVARRERDAVASHGALAFLALALVHALAVVAPVEALHAGLADPLAAIGALLAVAGAAVLTGRAPRGGPAGNDARGTTADALPTEDPAVTVALRALAAALLAYLAAQTLDGVALTAVWSLQAVLLSVLARHVRSEAAAWGGAAMAALALVHAVAVVAPVQALQTGPADPLAAAGSLLAACAALLIAARAPFSAAGVPAALRAVVAAALAYLAAQLLDGVPLVAAWALEAGALAALGRRTRAELASCGAVAGAVLALLYALVAFAPPGALIDGLDRPLDALAGLLAAVAALLAATRAPFSDARVKPALHAAAASAALYLASTELVTYAGAAGQTALSVFWAATGVALLVAGLVGDRARLREAALALLAVTAGKVFIYDLASLDSMARVGSLVGFGLLLLTGGFAWQRVRPRALPDLREAGADAR